MRSFGAVVRVLTLVVAALVVPSTAWGYFPAGGNGNGNGGGNNGGGNNGNGNSGATKMATPLVLILLDSSGSMEYLQGDVGSGDAAAPVCTDTYDPGFDYVKNRNIVAKEVLTGTILDYWLQCDYRSDPSREDYLYPIVHRKVNILGEQVTDGLIDLNIETIKFGLMTFDSAKSPSTQTAGMWSYPKNPSGLFYHSDILGNEVNLGARGANAQRGEFVEPLPANANASIRNTNDKVQEAILDLIPVGGTPISPLLEDANYYLTQDPNVLNDVYGDCRPKHILLLTDGKPTLGESMYGYGSSVDQAARLYSNDVMVHVVAFSVDSSDMANLNDIAEAGGTEKAMTAVTQQQLIANLTSIMNSILVIGDSRIYPSFTNQTKSIEDVQYQFNAAYELIPDNPYDKRGVLEQSIYRCDESCQTEDSDGGAELCDIFSITDALNLPVGLDRNMFAIIDGQLQELDKLNVYLTPDAINVPTSGTLAKVAPEYDQNDMPYIPEVPVTLGPASDPLVRETFKDQIIDLLLAKDKSSRRCSYLTEMDDMGGTSSYFYCDRLAGIFHSSPVAWGQPSLGIRLPSYNNFKNLDAIKDRPTVLYVGTADGFLHAFQVDRDASLPSADYGQELWAIAPHTLVKRWPELSTASPFLMEGTPVVKDIRMYRTSEEEGPWKTILVMGFRDGGRGYFALDVTDPVNPVFLWEISSEGRCVGNNGVPECYTYAEGADGENDFRTLGLAYSKPALGSVYYLDPLTGTGKEQAVAMFGGGRAPVGSAPNVGKSFFIVDLATGKKIKEFNNSCAGSGDCLLEDVNSVPDNLTYLDFDMIGSPNAYNSFPGKLITRTYIGDEGGQLWRIDTSSPDMSEWKMQFFHDAYAPLGLGLEGRGPIMEAPTVSYDDLTGRLIVVYGTGDIDNIEDTTQTHYVYSLSEDLLIEDETVTITAKTNWYQQLGEGEKVLGSPLIFGDVAYWTTYQVNVTNKCITGVGRLWGAHFVQDDPDALQAPWGYLDEDGLPETSSTVLYIEYPDTIIYGLAVSQRPACYLSHSLDYAVDNGITPDLSQVNPGDVQLVVQASSGSQTASSAANASPSGAMSNVKKIVHNIPKPINRMITTSWGLVFD